MRSTLNSISIIICIVIMFDSCKKDSTDPDSDNALLNEVQTGNYTYYMNGNVLSAAAASPHGSFKLRFNDIALAALDSTLELPVGNSFPNGSIVVKEVQDGGNINLFAIMKKDPSNKNSGSGWLWAEIKPDGKTTFSTAKKGDGCIGCHSQTSNRDLVRTFDLH